MGLARKHTICNKKGKCKQVVQKRTNEKKKKKKFASSLAKQKIVVNCHDTVDL